MSDVKQFRVSGIQGMIWGIGIDIAWTHAYYFYFYSVNLDFVSKIGRPVGLSLRCLSTALEG